MTSLRGLPGVLVDSGGFFALSDTLDENYQVARRIQAYLVSGRTRLFTSNFIIDEAYTLHLARLNYRAAITFLDNVVTSALAVLRITAEDEQRAQEILRAYDDKRFSYTDATSFALMDRLGLTHAFTFDANFSQYGKLLIVP